MKHIDPGNPVVSQPNFARPDSRICQKYIELSYYALKIIDLFPSTQTLVNFFNRIRVEIAVV